MKINPMMSYIIAIIVAVAILISYMDVWTHNNIDLNTVLNKTYSNAFNNVTCTRLATDADALEDCATTIYLVRNTTNTVTASNYTLCKTAGRMGTLNDGMRLLDARWNSYAMNVSYGYVGCAYGTDNGGFQMTIIIVIVLAAGILFTAYNWLKPK